MTMQTDVVETKSAATPEGERLQTIRDVIEEDPSESASRWRRLRADLG